MGSGGAAFFSVVSSSQTSKPFTGLLWKEEQRNVKRVRDGRQETRRARKSHWITRLEGVGLREGC